MNLSWVKSLIVTGKSSVIKHAPDILMGMGTVGVASSVILAAKAGPKAVYLIEDAECLKAEEMGNKDKNGKQIWRQKLTIPETIRATWKVYIPPVGLAMFGIACFWGAHGIDVKRQAILMGLYSTAEATLEEYQKKVVELIGQKQHDELKGAISEDKTAKLSVPQEAPTGLVGAGPTDIWYCIDGKTFPSNYNKVKNVQNDFNHDMMSEMYKSRAELYWMLDPSGEWLRANSEDQNVGWTLDRLLVLHVEQPFGPIATITYEDKDGLPYLPIPGFMMGK